MKFPSRTMAPALLLSLSLGTPIASVLAQVTVHTAFSFGTTTFFDLTPEDKSAVELRLARILAESGEAKFPFLEWRPTPSSGNQASGHWLILSMEETTQLAGGTEFVQIDLVFKPAVEDKVIDETILITLYPLGSSISRQDTSTMISDIERVITEEFDKSTFREDLERVLIGQVSLADSILIDEVGGVIAEGVIVPVRFDRFFPGDSSQLYVEITADDRRTGRSDSSVKINLTEPEERRREAWLGMTKWQTLQRMKVEAEEECFDFECLLDRWPDLRVTSTTVFMTRYRPEVGRRDINDLAPDSRDSDR